MPFAEIATFFYSQAVNVARPHCLMNVAARATTALVAHIGVHEISEERDVVAYCLRYKSAH